MASSFKRRRDRAPARVGAESVSLLIFDPRRRGFAASLGCARWRGQNDERRERQMSLANTTERTSLSDLTVEDAMHAGVLTCPMAAPLRLVARMMATHRIHCVV